MLRIIGVNAIKADPNNCASVGVHRIICGAHTEAWGVEERCCQLMNIGKVLDEEEPKRGYDACREEG